MEEKREKIINDFIDIIKDGVKESFIYTELEELKLIKNPDTNLDSIKDGLKDTLDFYDGENEEIKNILDEKDEKSQREKIYKYELKRFIVSNIQGFNVKNLMNGEYYFSAYPDDISVDDFSKKYIIWFSDKIHQSLLHPMDTKDFKQPVFFKFRLNKPILVLNNIYYSNEDIDLFKYFKFDYKKIIDVINDKSINIENLFLGNNNKYILYLIEAINRIINNPDLIIYGYKNSKDQDEIAITKFNEVIDKESIVKYKYTKIICDSKEIKFPLSNPQNINNLCPGIYGFYNGPYILQNSKFLPLSGLLENRKKDIKSKMMCHEMNLKIYYQIEDKSEEEKCFDCFNKKAEYFWAGKYKKYKQKYLELKAKLK